MECKCKKHHYVNKSLNHVLSKIYTYIAGVFDPDDLIAKISQIIER